MIEIDNSYIRQDEYDDGKERIIVSQKNEIGVVVLANGIEGDSLV